jgi:hypothetical protein
VAVAAVVAVVDVVGVVAVVALIVAAHGQALKGSDLRLTQVFLVCSSIIITECMFNPFLELKHFKTFFRRHEDRGKIS